MQQYGRRPYPFGRQSGLQLLGEFTSFDWVFGSLGFFGVFWAPYFLRSFFLGLFPFVVWGSPSIWVPALLGLTFGVTHPVTQPVGHPSVVTHPGLTFFGLFAFHVQCLWISQEQL